jgi:hypothetical protein
MNAITAKAPQINSLAEIIQKNINDNDEVQRR